MGIVGRGDTGLGDRTWQVHFRTRFPSRGACWVPGRAVVSSPHTAQDRGRLSEPRACVPRFPNGTTVPQAGFPFYKGHDFSVRIEHFGFKTFSAPLDIVLVSCNSYSFALGQWFTAGVILARGCVWQCLQTFLVRPAGGATCIEWVEPRDAAQHPGRHGTAVHSREPWGSQARGSKGENPALSRRLPEAGTGAACLLQPARAWAPQWVSLRMDPPRPHPFALACLCDSTS